MKTYYIYILASKKNGTLYIGVTSNLKQRIYQHKHHNNKGFTQKYNVNLLVYFEIYSDVRDAISREKQLKWWKREWKIDLIEKINPDWKDLYETID
jgi:putative endonuclease